MTRNTLLLLALLAPAQAASADDWLVDASGSQSDLTTIDHAMVQSSPGDRIFVLPGSYPPFQFSRGVEVIGLGAEPAEVVIARVDFHVNLPIVDYDAVLANLRVCGPGAADSISISGNELAAGTLLLHEVETCGGVFLHGDPGFYLLVDESHFAPAANAGFVGAAFDLAAGVADFVDSSVSAWDASVESGVPAGVALRVAAGSTVRVSSTTFQGGHGADAAALRDGAAAIVSSGATDVSLRLAGGSVARGGDGTPGGSGGDGLAVAGEIRIGDASVHGGGGGVPGLTYGLDPPIQLTYDPELIATPDRPEGSAGFGGRAVLVVLRIDGSIPTGATIAHAETLDAATGSPPSPLPTGDTTLHFGPALKVSQPVVWSRAPARAGTRRIYQAFFVDPETEELTATNPVVLELVR